MDRKIDEQRGLAIYQLRRDRGLTQQQVADGIDLSKQAISKFEHGIGFSLDTAIDLARFFKVELDYFLKQSKKESISSEKETDRIRIEKIVESRITPYVLKILELEKRVDGLESKLLE
jgi:transcriptional regulator with XRE-family HTH domain